MDCQYVPWERESSTSYPDVLKGRWVDVNGLLVELAWVEQQQQRQRQRELELELGALDGTRRDR